MRSKSRVKKLGEVFTPLELIDRWYREHPTPAMSDASLNVLDSSCGNGNFLVKMMEYRMKNDISHRDAIATLYGVDISPVNVRDCKKNLLMGSDDPALRKIVNRNIICANALDPQHKGWEKVGYMWDETKKPKNEYQVDLFME